MIVLSELQSTKFGPRSNVPANNTKAGPAAAIAFVKSVTLFTKFVGPPAPPVVVPLTVANPTNSTVGKFVGGGTTISVAKSLAAVPAMFDTMTEYTPAFVADNVEFVAAASGEFVLKYHR